MNDKANEIGRLQEKICVLENENRLLKELLKEAGVSFENVVDDMQ